jgi:sulfatase maturation enzyme AslB (radical SAM superfamily)
LRRKGFAIGLVTNGTLVDRWKDEILKLGESLRWVRVSIDAAERDTYMNMRRAAPGQFDKAWEAVSWFSQQGPGFHREFEIGVGFVQSNPNMGEAEEFIRMAMNYGADNVRLSMTFSDKHRDFFEDAEAADAEVEKSRHYTRLYGRTDFAVHNMMPSRWGQMSNPVQDYEKCYMKDLICVVEGECKVYTCCTFAGSLQGLYGKFNEHPGGFRGLWESTEQTRQQWDAREKCKVFCLYRDRNLEMIDIVSKESAHKEFV